MEILIILNQWLEPQYFDHWQISAKLQLCRLQPSFLMQNSGTCQTLQEVRQWCCDGRSWTQVIALRFKNPFPLYYWSPLREYSATVVGVRWTSGTFTIVLPMGEWREFTFYTPFRLQYPWHIPMSVYSRITQQPNDLEFCYCWVKQSEQIGEDDIANYQQKLAAVLQEIKCRF